MDVNNLLVDEELVAGIVYQRLLDRDTRDIVDAGYYCGMYDALMLIVIQMTHNEDQIRGAAVVLKSLIQEGIMRGASAAPYAPPLGVVSDN